MPHAKNFPEYLSKTTSCNCLTFQLPEAVETNKLTKNINVCLGGVRSEEGAHVQMFKCPQRPEKGARSPEAGVIGLVWVNKDS